jgi:hypothetical protein
VFQVARHPLDWDLSAADALRLVRHDPHPVVLLGAWAVASDIVDRLPRLSRGGRVLAHTTVR